MLKLQYFLNEKRLKIDQSDYSKFVYSCICCIVIRYCIQYYYNSISTLMTLFSPFSILIYIKLST